MARNEFDRGRNELADMRVAHGLLTAFGTEHSAAGDPLQLACPAGLLVAQADVENFVVVTDGCSAGRFAQAGAELGVPRAVVEQATNGVGIALAFTAGGRIHRAGAPGLIEDAQVHSEAGTELAAAEHGADRTFQHQRFFHAALGNVQQVARHVKVHAHWRLELPGLGRPVGRQTPASPDILDDVVECAGRAVAAVWHIEVQHQAAEQWAIGIARAGANAIRRKVDAVRTVDMLAGELGKAHRRPIASRR